VADDRLDPSEQIPDADLLEQQAPLDPPLTDAEPIWVGQEAPTEPVDEPDRWDQHVPVPAAEDDCPHGPFEAGWS
jgi:hypothetical protein